MIGEIISGVMTDGFFPSTMDSGSPAAKLSHAAAQSAWSRLLQSADHNWTARACPPGNAIIAQQHFE
jgi:hypothetical protein